jgi:hypothetical protein
MTSDTEPQQIPCLGGPMDGKTAPLISWSGMCVYYPARRGSGDYCLSDHLVTLSLDRGQYTVERFVRREWGRRDPTEQEMKEWERQMEEWRKPAYELSFIGQVAREMFGGKGLPPPMPRTKYTVRDRTAFAFVWEVAATGKTMRPEWDARLMFNDPPWRIDLDRELDRANGGVA